MPRTEFTLRLPRQMNVFSSTATKGCGARQTPSYTSLGCLCTAARGGSQLGEAKRENKIIPRVVPPRFSLRSQTEPRATGNDYQTWISSGKKFFHCSTSNLQEKFGKFASHSPGTSCDRHTQAAGRAQLAARTRPRSTKPGSGLLGREAGDCTRDFCST